MDRRAFLRAGGAATLSLATVGCLPRRAPLALPERRLVHLVPPDVSWDRIIRTTVGLRPYRESGFLLQAERFDDRTVIHNFGHGGAGMSLSWGTGQLAAELALEHPERRAAVVGCGMVGLTAARQLQRRGFDVTIYAAALPPETTSNMSLASFTPTSGLVSSSRRTPEWDGRFRRAVEIAYREHQLLVGRGYGVSWIDEYSMTNNPPGGGGGRGALGGGQAAGGDAAGGRAAGGAAGGGGAPAGARGRGEGPPPLLPSGVSLGEVVFDEGEHPFPTRFARRRPTLRFEPSIYLEALMRDVLVFGGRIVVRRFDTPRDLMTLAEPVIVNCTGLGAKQLFGDEELAPVKGQLVVLVPQPEVNYTTGSMLPRSDGIVLGHVMERDEWSLEVSEEQRQRVMESHMRTFSAMRRPDPGVGLTTVGTMAAPPPVESFSDRES